jgi:[acyl-carrier-protein] S-malonyltransferase
MSRDLTFVFPGQGSQYVGMGRDLEETFVEAHGIFAQADDILEFSLSRLCFEGPEAELNDTINTQPAIFTMSVACLHVLKAREDWPTLNERIAFVAGHSLGEYSALVAAGALDFADGLKLVRERGRLMKEAGVVSPGGMAAIMNLEAETVDAICQQASQETGKPVQAANYNSPGQIVISGDKAALERAMALAQEGGARRVIPLAVSIAAHSPLMARANEAFGRAVSATPIRVPAIPVIANVTAQPLPDVRAIQGELVSQLTSPVRWSDSVRYMIERGVTTFVELGPKNVLCGLIGRIDKEVKTVAVGDTAGVQALAL